MKYLILKFESIPNRQKQNHSVRKSKIDLFFLCLSPPLDIARRLSCNHPIQFRATSLNLLHLNSFTIPIDNSIS